MKTSELIDILKSEEAYFTGMPDISEVLLYGSALAEEEIAEDVDLLVVPGREMTEGEKVELRQQVWERLKDRMPSALDVQTPKEGLDKETLASKGVHVASVFSR